MPWEIISGRSSSFGIEKLGKDEVSIVSSTQGQGKPAFRICMLRELFPKDTRNVIVQMDKEKKRIGFFKTKEGQEFQGKALSSFGKAQTDKAYVSMKASIITELGFEKGRYEILKSKDGGEDMYFYISVKKKKESSKPADEKVEDKE